MIRLELFNKKELLNLLNSGRLNTMPRIPISELRGHSQVENPDANDDDVLLVVAFENELMVGYLGVLPTARNFATENLDNCGWFSCLWVDLNQRGKGVSRIMLTKGFEVWKNQILLTEYVPAIKGMYQALGVFEEYSIPGIRLYIRGDFGTILPPKHKLFLRSKTLLKAFDGLVNTVFDLRFKFAKDLKNLKIEETKTIDPSLAEFINNHRGTELFPRDMETLQWLIDNPWVRSGRKMTPMEEKYYFTSVSKRFEFRPLIIRNEHNEIVAFFIFALRDNHLRIPYLYSAISNIQLVDVIYHLICKWKVGTVTTYQSALVDAMKKRRFPVYHSKEVGRHFMIHSDMMSQIDWQTNPVIQDGDGDCAFT